MCWAILQHWRICIGYTETNQISCGSVMSPHVVCVHVHVYSGWSNMCGIYQRQIKYPEGKYLSLYSLLHIF